MAEDEDDVIEEFPTLGMAEAEDAEVDEDDVNQLRKLLSFLCGGGWGWLAAAVVECIGDSKDRVVLLKEVPTNALGAETPPIAVLFVVELDASNNND